MVCRLVRFGQHTKTRSFKASPSGRGLKRSPLCVRADRNGRHCRWVYSQPLADSAAVLWGALAEVPDHALLDVAVGLRQLFDQVFDQLVALPWLERAEAFTRLLVVVLIGN